MARLFITDHGRGNTRTAHGRKRTPDGLRRRQLRALWGRMAAAICAGFAVFAALTCVLSTVETVPVLVAARTVRRGTMIRAADVALVHTPRAAVVEDALHTDAGAIGLVAQIDVAAGQPLYPTAIRAAPVPPEHATVLQVRVASDVTTLLPGDHVALASAAGCPAGRDPPCTLTDQALVMAQPTRTADDGVGGQLSLALPPEAALTVMAIEDAGAIVAVTPARDSTHAN